MIRSLVSLLVALPPLALACEEDRPEEAFEDPSVWERPAASGASDTYATRCAACHGVTGDGRAPGADALPVKPPNFTDKAWQANITDDEIKDITVRGGPALGKDPGMPPAADLAKKPEALDKMVQTIRGFGK